MHDQIGFVVLGSLSALFTGYGIWELALAFRTAALRAWSERAAIATGSMFVGAVFAVMTIQGLGGPVN